MLGAFTIICYYHQSYRPVISSRNTAAIRRFLGNRIVGQVAMCVVTGCLTGLQSLQQLSSLQVIMSKMVACRLPGMDVGLLESGSTLEVGFVVGKKKLTCKFASLCNHDSTWQCNQSHAQKHFERTEKRIGIPMQKRVITPIT